MVFGSYSALPDRQVKQSLFPMPEKYRKDAKSNNKSKEKNDITPIEKKKEENAKSYKFDMSLPCWLDFKTTVCNDESGVEMEVREPSFGSPAFNFSPFKNEESNREEAESSDPTRLSNYCIIDSPQWMVEPIQRESLLSLTAVPAQAIVDSNIPMVEVAQQALSGPSSFQLRSNAPRSLRDENSASTSKHSNREKASDSDVVQDIVEKSSSRSSSIPRSVTGLRIAPSRSRSAHRMVDESPTNVKGRSRSVSHSRSGPSSPTKTNSSTSLRRSLRSTSPVKHKDLPSLMSSNRPKTDKNDLPRQVSSAAGDDYMNTSSHTGMAHKKSALCHIKETSTLNDSKVPSLQYSRPMSTTVEEVASKKSSAKLLSNNMMSPINKFDLERSLHRFIPPKGMATRSLLTASVYHNRATGLWITTINTNQHSNGVNKSNAAKYLKAFSFHSEREARESAYAYAPPKMCSFDQYPNCFSCNTKFSLFKRASHCRNCGVCICSSCHVLWNKLMIPETYNIKNEKAVKVCKSCDFLSRTFRRSLSEGNYEEAVAVYNTGNINLRCPFMNIKGSEAVFPIHCAFEGGNIDIIIWLVDVHFCPIKVFHTGNRYSTQGSDEQFITTSKGRTVLDIALAGKNVDIIRYLVNDKNVSVYGVKDLNITLGALDVTVKALGPFNASNYDWEEPDDDDLEPEEFVGISSCKNVVAAKVPTLSSESIQPNSKHVRDNRQKSSDIPSFVISGPYDDDCSSDAQESAEINQDGIDNISDEESVITTIADACILCYENSIDCVITPCGHQICCLHCSKNLSHCPVCNIECQFIRIFKP